MGEAPRSWSPGQGTWQSRAKQTSKVPAREAKPDWGPGCAKVGIVPKPSQEQESGGKIRTKTFPNPEEKARSRMGACWLQRDLYEGILKSPARRRSGSWTGLSLRCRGYSPV